MPGKILRIHVEVGVVVKKGQAIMVMEAMKMENEIKSPQDGTIKEIKVSEGHAVETGAELVIFH
jgi:biotin carboxyl carrier protein